MWSRPKSRPNGISLSLLADYTMGRGGPKLKGLLYKGVPSSSDENSKDKEYNNFFMKNASAYLILGNNRNRKKWRMTNRNGRIGITNVENKR